MPPFSKCHGPDWHPAFPPRGHTHPLGQSDRRLSAHRTARAYTVRRLGTHTRHTPARAKVAVSDRLSIASHRIDSCLFASFRTGDKSESQSPSRPRLWPNTACSFATTLVSVLELQTAIGSVRAKRGPIASRPPNSRSHPYPGGQTEPGASDLHGVKGRSAGSVLQTVPWLAGCVLWPPTCLCWLAHRQASGPPAPAPFSVLALLADLPGRPRTVPTCRPSPGPAPPVSPAFPTPKAATGCASPLKRAVETKKTTDPTLLGRGTLPVR